EGIIQTDIEAADHEDDRHIDLRPLHTGPMALERVDEPYGHESEIENPEEWNRHRRDLRIGSDERHAKWDGGITKNCQRHPHDDGCQQAGVEGQAQRLGRALPPPASYDALYRRCKARHGRYHE